MRNKTAAGLCFIIAAFVLVAVSTFWQPCQGYMEMPCQYSTRFARVGLVIIMFLSALRFFRKEKPLQIISAILTALLSVGLLFVPLLGSCLALPGMTCITQTWPTLRVGGLLMLAITVIFGGWQILSARRAFVVHNR